MATLEQIIQAIETRLQTISGLRTNDITPGQVAPPWAIVGVPPIPSYHATFGVGGKWRIEPTVTVGTSSSMDRAGQQKLLALADRSGSSSIFAAIEADRTLGGTVEDCVVDSFRPLNLVEVGEVGYFGGIFDLRVIAPGS
jgi:hypothetical protein